MPMVDQLVSPVGVGDLAQIAHRLAQPRRVQPGRRFEQDGFGPGGDVGGELVGAVSEDLGVGH
jgi:hypothetical protein